MFSKIQWNSFKKDWYKYVQLNITVNKIFLFVSVLLLMTVYVFFFFFFGIIVWWMLVFSIKNSFVFKKALLWLVLERCQYLRWDSGWANGLLFYHSQLCAIQNTSSYVGCIVILSSSFLSESILYEMFKSISLEFL